jgi:hypothetical protein
MAVHYAYRLVRESCRLASEAQCWSAKRACIDPKRDTVPQSRHSFLGPKAIDPYAKFNSTGKITRPAIQSLNVAIRTLDRCAERGNRCKTVSTKSPSDLPTLAHGPRGLILCSGDTNPKTALSHAPQILLTTHLRPILRRPRQADNSSPIALSLRVHPTLS